jgi:WD40 repeat protein
MNTKQIIYFLMFFFSFISLVNTASARPPVPSHGIRDIVFSHDSSKIIFRSDKNNQFIQFLDVKSGKVIKKTPVKINSQNEFSMGFTPDGNKLTIGIPNKISIVHNQTGKVLRQLPVPPPFTRNYYPFRAILNASGSQQLFHNIQDRKAFLYVVHTGSGKVLRTIPLPKDAYYYRGTLDLSAIGMSPDGRDVAYITTPRKGHGNKHKQTLVIYDTFQKKIKKSMTLPNLVLSTVTKMEYSPDGQKIAISGFPTSLIDLKTEKITLIKEDHINQVFFSADSKKLALLPHENKLLVFDISSGKTTREPIKINSRCRANAHAISLNKRYAALGILCSGWGIYDKPDSILLLNAKSLKVIRDYTISMEHSRQ